jgi:hypothetical protein
MKKTMIISLLIAATLVGCKHHPPKPPTPPDPPPTPDLTTFIQSDNQKLMIHNQQWKMTLDTAWLITERIGGNVNDISAYLDARKKQGFNTIMFGCGGDWFDKSVSNPKQNLFSNMDTILNQLESRNMFAVPCIQMHQYDNGKPIIVLPVSEADSFGKFFANRYKDRTSIAFWMIGGLDDKGVV